MKVEPETGVGSWLIGKTNHKIDKVDRTKLIHPNP